MGKSSSTLPLGNSRAKRVVRSTSELGAMARSQRESLGLRQEDLSGLGNTGTRFIGDMERGKPTIQFQMVLDLLDLLGLEVVVQPKSAGS